jgi:hypothetical protein
MGASLMALLLLLLLGACGPVLTGSSGIAGVLPSTAPAYPTSVITEERDWLVDDIDTRTALRQLDSRTVALTNGIVSRVFTLAPDWATWDVVTTKGSALRGVSPEATVTLDGIEYYVGGLVALKDDGRTTCPQPFGLTKVADNCPTAYFNRSTPMGANSTAFRYAGHTTTAPVAPFPWTPARHAPPVAWPPHGLQLVVNFTNPTAAHALHRAITVSVHYELYDGAPIMTKWLSFHSAAPPTPPSPLAAASTAAATVPPDQQGPVCLQPCHLKLPASDWESHWKWLPGGAEAAAATNGSTAAQYLQLSGAMASRLLCLQIVQPQAVHGGNDDLDVRPCNSSEPLQLWVSDKNGSIYSAAPLAVRKAIGLAAESVFVDVNNHQTDPGTTLQLSGCHTCVWKRVPPPTRLLGGSNGTDFQLASETYGGGTDCAWHTPLPPPPPAPPPPPPRPPCTGGCVVVTSAVLEILRVNQPWGPTEPRPLVDSDHSRNRPGSIAGGGDDDDARDQIRTGSGLLYVHPAQGHGSEVIWANDPTFDTAYAGNIGANEPILTAGYMNATFYGGPAHRLQPGADYTTYRLLELWSDSVEPERKGLSRRKMTRLLAPQTSEAPLFFHLTDSSSKAFRHAVDQMHAVGGFDMLIYSFGSGFQLENTDPLYLAGLKADIKYARDRGIEVGGYDLISDTRTGTGFDAIDPADPHKHLNDACFASGWNKELTSRVLTQMAAANLSMLETDGPYAGNPCASHSHDHYDYADSIEMQWRGQTEFYSLMREHGVFVHAPDDYLFAGGANKECGGYEENQMSLPRWQWLSIAHQENYDDTWTETPTQAWMFAPLTDYHAGGAAAALEPFAENMVAWEWTLGTFLGHGRGACYRGDELFDTPAVQAMVTKWASFWTKYRAILIQDIVHIRRPDMQSIDSVMHVTANKTASVCALAMFYNPSLFTQTASFALPMYYTGEMDAVWLEGMGNGTVVKASLARDYSVRVNVTLKAREISYTVVHRGGARPPPGLVVAEY